MRGIGQRLFCNMFGLFQTVGQCLKRSVFKVVFTARANLLFMLGWVDTLSLGTAACGGVIVEPSNDR
jgi:hypothetical protein